MANVGVRYTSIATAERPGVFSCERCGYSTPVTVVGVGQGSSDASHLLGNYDSAKEKAQAGAAMDAELDVNRMLGLVACPRCQRRSVAGVRAFWMGQAGRLGVWLLGTTVFVLFVFHSASPLALLAVWVTSVLLTAGVYNFALSPRFEFTRAAMCVRFPK